MNKSIDIKGAREHNLKNFNLVIPRNQLVVITGLSGSGKSSLAFDTIYAEGQRRYLESLSAYARQFLEQMKKPAVNAIDGLSPSISIEQKNISRNPRSTVGTITEIYDYLRLLYARTGEIRCHSCGKPVESQTISQIVDQIKQYPQQTKFAVLAPIVRGKKGEYKKELSELRRQGFVRARIDGKDVDLGESIQLRKNLKHDISIYVDRLVLKPAIHSRLAESVEIASELTKGIIEISVADLPGSRFFSTQFACVDCGISYSELEPRSFSFNSPHGFCESCKGLGVQYEFDPEKIIPDPSLSLMEGAVDPWALKTGSWKKRVLAPLGKKFGFDPEAPYHTLSEDAQQVLLHGSSGKKLEFKLEGKSSFKQSFEGIIPSLNRKLEEAREEEVESGLEAYLSPMPCDQCKGARLKPTSLSVFVGGLNIADTCALSVNKCREHLLKIDFTKGQQEIVKPVLKEVHARLDFLSNVGLDYLTLNRSAATLSGGESQRIRLATQIGSHLVGVLYVLDEPSIGLHQRDNERLIGTLEKLRDIGNSVLVVEHDEDTIRRADHVIDIGPGAGKHGGQITFSGPPKKITQSKESLTGKYLTGKKTISTPSSRRKLSEKKVVIKGATKHNLKNIDVSFPLGNFICVTGVSGSGKSTLVIDTLLKALATKKVPIEATSIDGLSLIDKVIHVDQSPIGRTPRSNPATYTGTFTDIRNLFASLPESKMRGYKPSRFSFNIPGGRCEACRGDGNLKISMHFLPDVYVPCEVCRGRRYNRETLLVNYKGKSISDVLNMPIEEAASFFEKIPKLRNKFKTLLDVGLGYVHVGQSAVTLSGGEAQRIKLSKELVKRATGKTFYVLDEPTTGLHFADVEKLMQILHQLVDQGNTVIVIEHHLDVIKQADYIVDLGPEGGQGGGEIVYEGAFEGLLKSERSYTAAYLKKLLSGGPIRSSAKKKTRSSQSALGR